MELALSDRLNYNVAAILGIDEGAFVSADAASTHSLAKRNALSRGALGALALSALAVAVAVLVPLPFRHTIAETKPKRPVMIAGLSPSTAKPAVPKPRPPAETEKPEAAEVVVPTTLTRMIQSRLPAKATQPSRLERRPPEQLAAGRLGQEKPSGHEDSTASLSPIANPLSEHSIAPPETMSLTATSAATPRSTQVVYKTKSILRREAVNALHDLRFK